MRNLIIWLKDLVPSGIGRLDVFDEDFNSFYKNYLKRKKISNYLFISAEL